MSENAEFNGGAPEDLSATSEPATISTDSSAPSLTLASDLSSAFDSYEALKLQNDDSADSDSTAASAIEAQSQTPDDKTQAAESPTPDVDPAQFESFKSTYSIGESLQPVLSEFKEYFDGTACRAPNGQPVQPAEAFRFLLAVQKEFDRDPMSALLRVADNYGLRDTLAERAMRPRSETDDLKQQLDALNHRLNSQDHSKRIEAEQRVAAQHQDQQRVHAQAELKKLTSDLPLFGEIPLDDLQFYLSKAAATMPANTPDKQLMNAAYDMAVNADPALRAKKDVAKKSAADLQVANLKSEAQPRKAVPKSLADALSLAYDEINSR